jgi:CRISPR/Cas system Type II protein with McrA/HNH and RuvC-like nuclease domain
VIVSSYSFIDASTGDYQEEEVFYQEEGEENFDHYHNQAKLLQMQARLIQVILLQANILAKCKALQEQGTTTFYFMLNSPIPSFYSISFIEFDLSKLLFDS